MRATVIEHEDEEGLGILADVLAARGIVTQVTKAHAGEPVPQSAADVLILLGGPMAAYDDLPVVRHSIALAKNTIAAGKPVLGICLGSQLLATALGGTVRKARAPENGWLPITRDDAHDPVFADLPSTFTVLHAHGDTYALPPACTLLAHSEMTPCQAYRYRENVYGLQFHLEATPQIARKMLGVADESMHDRTQAHAFAFFSRWAATLRA
jgi:GMP synthase (glutamine-hydrolysing)